MRYLLILHQINHIYLDKYQESLKTIKDLQSELDSSNAKCQELDVANCDLELKYRESSKKVKILENAMDTGDVLPLYNKQIEYLETKLMKAYKQLDFTEITSSMYYTNVLYFFSYQ